MSWNTWGRWGAVLMMVGCGSKLQVDTNPPAGGVSGGSGGSLTSFPPEGAGRGPINFGGTGGVGGTQVVTEPPVPGSYGQPCIQSRTTTEGAGTVGQADVVDLIHCADGLTCGSEGKCGGIPNCPQPSGICVVSPGQPEPNGGGGTGGGDCSGNAGCGNPGGGPSGVGGDGQGIALPESGVQAVAADDTRVYWIEYGTRDALGNYAGDGALKASDGTAITALSSKLRGPIALGLTSSHAYVFVDGAPLLGTTLKPQLLRIPLAGGEPELVQEGAVPLSFASAGARAFWGTVGNIYTVTSEAAAVASVFQPATPYPTGLVADDTNLFYVDAGGSGQIQSAPFSGGPPTSLGFTMYSFFLRGDSIYGVDPAEAVLDQAPKAGGSVERFRALGVYGGTQLVGDRFFWEQGRDNPNDTRLTILSASFTSDGISRVLQASSKSSWISVEAQWAANATALYWTDGNAIYSRSLSDLK